LINAHRIILEKVGLAWTDFEKNGFETFLGFDIKRKVEEKKKRRDGWR